MSQWIVEKRECDYEYLTYTTEMLSYVYPFLKLGTVGYTWAGKKIYSLSIGNPTNQSIYTASIHGSEWITSIILLRFVEELCKYYRSDKEFSSINIANVLMEKGVVFVPCLNPDGVEINLHGYHAGGIFTDSIKDVVDTEFNHWNANARGVDLNKNFDAGWNELHDLEMRQGIIGPNGDQYGGVAPESELETYAITKLCRESGFTTAFELCSQGEEIFYKYDNIHVPESDLMAKILASSCGYKIANQDEFTSRGTFKDWFIKEFQRPAFRIEVGKGENPLPLEQLHEIYYKVREMLLLGLLF